MSWGGVRVMDGERKRNFGRDLEGREWKEVGDLGTHHS